MKCPFCNGNEFTAHQVCHMDILVDGDNMFLANISMNPRNLSARIPARPAALNLKIWTTP